MDELVRTFAASQRPLPEAPKQGAPPTYIWYGCDLVSGDIIEELPFTPSGPLVRVLGAYASLGGKLAVPDAPDGWEAATTPGQVMLVCVRADDEVPLWAGIVIDREGGSDEDVELSLVSLEGYFDRRYVTDAVYTQQDGSQIAMNLKGMADAEGINIVFSAAYVLGTKMDRTYKSDSDQTIYSQLTELMGVQGGPEWTVEVSWANAAKTSFRKGFHVEKTIGRGSWTNPEAVFDLPGNVMEYKLSEDFTSGKGANHIEYFGDGEGETRPSGTPARAEDLLAAGFPRYEFRKTISGATQASTLSAHAQEALSWRRQGARIVTLKANAATAPRVEIAWSLGSPVMLDVVSSYRHPQGFQLIGRAIGWELDTIAGTITPILEEADQ